MNNAVLSCQGIAKTFYDGATTVEVLKDINLDVAPAEMLAIVGTSGSGKSTLLHILGGLDKPSKGYVEINQQKIFDLKENEKCRLRNRSLGFVYQFHHLLPEFSALENVSMPLLIRGDQPKQIQEKAANLLEQVGLGHRLKHQTGQLSGGERQRVAIARALVTEPLCILADEPTGNLDPANSERVMQLIMDLQASQKTSVVMVTHDVAMARQAHRTLTIEQGVLVNLD